MYIISSTPATTATTATTGTTIGSVESTVTASLLVHFHPPGFILNFNLRSNKFGKKKSLRSAELDRSVNQSKTKSDKVRWKQTE